MVNFVNLTPHDVNIFDDHDQEIMAIPASGTIARRSQREEILFVIDGIPITHQVFGEVQDLPEPQEDTIFIVSRLVAVALPDRRYLMIPGPISVRDENGQPRGCHGLSVVF